MGQFPVPPTSAAVSASEVLALAPELRPSSSRITPRFSDAELKRRHASLAGVMEGAGADHLLSYRRRTWAMRRAG